MNPFENYPVKGQGCKVKTVWPVSLNVLGMTAQQRDMALRHQRMSYASALTAIKGHYGGLKQMPTNVSNPLEEEPQEMVVNTEYVNNDKLEELEPLGGKEV